MTEMTQELWTTMSLRERAVHNALALTALGEGEEIEVWANTGSLQRPVFLWHTPVTQSVDVKRPYRAKPLLAAPPKKRE